MRFGSVDAAVASGLGLDELRQRSRRFARDFTEHWLLERHGYRTPSSQAREVLRQAAMA